jgi:uncharacterized membrane protein YbaN (DUF454 family)
MEEKKASRGSTFKKKGQKLVRALWFIAGTMCLLLGAIGIVLPVLPTTPFLLAAAACYYKSSARMHKWLLNNRWFGEYIKNYKEGRGLTLKVKITALILLWITISFSAFFMIDILAVQLILLAVAIAVSTDIIRLPTFKKA